MRISSVCISYVHCIVYCVYCSLRVHFLFSVIRMSYPELGARKNIAREKRTWSRQAHNHSSTCKFIYFIKKIIFLHSFADKNSYVVDTINKANTEVFEKYTSVYKSMIYMDRPLKYCAKHSVCVCVNYENLACIISRISTEQAKL